MASPLKSPQHKQAHAGQSNTIQLTPTNKTDVASFIGGVSATTPVTGSYYQCNFQSPKHSSFYYMLEATRRINRAVLKYQGRKTNIKKAVFSNHIMEDVYRAGVGS